MSREISINNLASAFQNFWNSNQLNIQRTATNNISAPSWLPSYIGTWGYWMKKERDTILAEGFCGWKRNSNLKWGIGYVKRDYFWGQYTKKCYPDFKWWKQLFFPFWVGKNDFIIRYHLVFILSVVVGLEVCFHLKIWILSDCWYFDLWVCRSFFLIWVFLFF